MKDRYKEGMAVIVVTGILAFITTDAVMDYEPVVTLKYQTVVFFIFWVTYGVLFALLERLVGLGE